MSNRNYGSRLAHGFYLQCQVGAGATVNKCSYLRGPPQPSGTHTGSSLTGSSLAVHPRPGFASLPKARGEAREAAQGEQELLRMAVGTSVTAPRHTLRAERNSVSGLLAAMTQPSSRWSAKAPRLGFGITYWPGMPTGCAPEKQAKVRTLAVQAETKLVKKLDG